MATCARVATEQRLSLSDDVLLAVLVGVVQLAFGSLVDQIDRRDRGAGGRGRLGVCASGGEPFTLRVLVRDSAVTLLAATLLPPLSELSTVKRY